MKIKNKLILLIFMLLSILPVTDVKANECDGSEYACAVCTYNGDVKYVAKSNGTTVELTPSTVILTNFGEIGTSNLIGDDFVDDSTNMIKCPPTIKIATKKEGKTPIYDVYLSGNCGIEYESVFGENLSSACVEQSLIADMSYNNNKTIVGETKEVISCKYGSTTINGWPSTTPGEILVDGYVKVIDGVVTYEFSDGYVLRDGEQMLPAGEFTNGTCPDDLEMKCGTCDAMDITCHEEGQKVCTLTKKNTEKENQDVPEENTNTGESNAGFINDIDQKYVTCNGTDIPYGIPYIVHNIVNIIKVGIPIILIILGMVDFLKAVVANDEKQMKNSQTTFIRRLIAAVLIFFVFVIVQFVFSLIDSDSTFGCVNCLINKECGTVKTYGDSDSDVNNNDDINNDSDCGCELYKQSGSICGWTTTQQCVSGCKETTDIYKCEAGTTKCAMGSGTISTIYTAKRCQNAGCEKYKTCTDSNS